MMDETSTGVVHEDQSLIEASQQDPKEFFVLYEKYVDRIFQFIYYRVGSQRDVAEDLAQEVFVRSLKNIRTFRWQGYPYSAYLYRVARAVCKEHYSEKQIEDIEQVVLEDIQSTSASTQADMQLLWEHIRSNCSEELQEILLLRYVEDLSYDEIAGMLNKKPGAIRTMVSRAITKLQQEYGQTL